MKHIILLSGVLSALCAAEAKPQITSPAQNAVVPLVKAEQKAFLDMSREGRRAWLADAKQREKSEKVGCLPATVKLTWTGAAGAVDVTVRRVRDGHVVFTTNAVDLAQVEIDNLEIACAYTWRVADADGAAESSFTTEDYAPRFIRVPKIENLRDLGGRIGLNGRRVRQGLVYRSVGLNDNATRVYLSTKELEKAVAAGSLEQLLATTTDTNLKPTDVKKYGERIRSYIKKDTHLPDRYGKRFLLTAKLKPGAERLTPETRAYMTDVMGIRTDLDLRSFGEVYGMKGSPLGPKVKWVHVPFSGYGGMGESEGKEAFRKAFRVFLDEANYPIDFHCIAGADRTGSLAFILNGLLGVCEEELYKDWETTAFTARSKGFNHKERFDFLVKVFDAFPGKTINERIEAYVLSLGFTAADIAKFRSLMLEVIAKPRRSRAGRPPDGVRAARLREVL